MTITTPLSNKIFELKAVRQQVNTGNKLTLRQLTFLSFKYLIRVGVLLLTLLLSQNLMAQEESNEQAPLLQLVGEGQMSWMFWDVYKIRLLSTTGQYRQHQFPQRLEITYLRGIEKQDLLTATIQEWQNLNISINPEWTTSLQQIWPTVTEGDSLMLDVKDNGHSYFYYNGRELGLITDKDFAKAFLAIWLSPNTSEKQLRAKLIGADNA